MTIRWAKQSFSRLLSLGLLALALAGCSTQASRVDEIGLNYVPSSRLSGTDSGFGLASGANPSIATTTGPALPTRRIAKPVPVKKAAMSPAKKEVLKEMKQAGVSAKKPPIRILKLRPVNKLPVKPQKTTGSMPDRVKSAALYKAASAKKTTILKKADEGKQQASLLAKAPETAGQPAKTRPAPQPAPSFSALPIEHNFAQSKSRFSR